MPDSIPEVPPIVIRNFPNRWNVWYLIKRLVSAAFVQSLISPSIFHEPDFPIDDALVHLWAKGQLTEAEEMLTMMISLRKSTHQMLVSRALIRARLQKWTCAIADAEMAIKIQPSVMAYIAKSIAHVGNGEKQKGYRACDIAFEYLHSSHDTFLRLIKAIIVFMTGDHIDALSRMDDLITTVPSSPECCMVQAYMHLLVGNAHMKSGDYESAIRSFEHARGMLRSVQNKSLFLVSLISGWKFDNVNTTIPQRLCEALYSAGWIMDATECFQKLRSAFGEEMDLQDEYLEWAYDFRRRCCKQVEGFGDTAVGEKRYLEAISRYSTALSLDPPSPHEVIIKRSKAYLAIGSGQRALDDANQAISLDPSSPWGYEMKHAALHKAEDHDGAIEAFEMMLSKLEQSHDPTVQRLADWYIRPSSTRVIICKIAHKINRRLPRELVNTTDGRLYDRAARLSAFQASPICRQLVSPMTIRIDKSQIKREVRQYFRYVTFSHKWEENEPSFQDVMDTSVYRLDASPTNDKLKTFCSVVRNIGIVWAWSDVCCINKSDHFILQEALVAMFKWYEGSTLTIVYLRGVHSLSELGALVRSMWNTRAWTLQEYIAAKVVHFYTEDWTPYLNLSLRSNHKESQRIISEMEEATGVSGEELMALRPGLSNIREKLRLASKRETTFPEDAAYSLLGIFSASGIPAIYGEGSGALGRLLANVLTRSGDVGILAWSGESGRFNTCLPAGISAFNRPVTTHLPQHISDSDMDTILSTSPLISSDVNTALRLYERLRELPTPRFSESRLTFPCIVFCLPHTSLQRTVDSLRIYRTNTEPFGVVEIKTKHDLSQYGTLYLVHPWLESLLERENVHGGAYGDIPPPSPTPGDEESDEEEMTGEGIDNTEFDDSSPPTEPPSPVLTSPTELAHMDMETRARRMVARLRQPFGALLLRLTAVDQRVVGYKRVAADSLVVVQFREDFPLSHILERVRTVDVL